jgi:hypothetical protein
VACFDNNISISKLLKIDNGIYLYYFLGINEPKIADPIGILISKSEGAFLLAIGVPPDNSIPCPN